MLAAAGTVNGVRTIAFCTDGTVMGGAMGIDGCRHIVNAYDTAIEQSPIIGIGTPGAPGWPRCEGTARSRLMFEAMIRASATSRRSPWSWVRRRRRRLRSRIDRRRHHGAGGPGSSRARTSCAASPARTSTWRRSVARTRTTRSPASATSWPTTSSTPTRGRRLIGLFSQQGHFDRNKAEAGDSDLHALLPDSPRAPTTYTRSSAPCSTPTPLRGVPGQVGTIDGGRPRSAGRSFGRRPRQQPAAPWRLSELRRVPRRQRVSSDSVTRSAFR